MTVRELLDALRQFPLAATVYKVTVYADEPTNYEDPSPYLDDMTGEVHL